jgi:hypothetical protein
MLHDDINQRLRLGLRWPGRAEASPPPVAPPHEATIRSSLFDELAAYHESAHCVFNWMRREPVHSVEIEGQGIGGGEFKSTPTSGAMAPREDDDVQTRAALDLRIAGALLDPGTRESWLARLPGFIVPLFAQRKFGAVGKFYDDVCGSDVLIVDRILAVMERDPAERRPLRARVYFEAREFVDRYWSEIKKLGGEIFRRGKLDKREIEEVLAPVHKPASAPAKRTESSVAFRTVAPRVAAAFHEAGHILGAIRQGQTIKSVAIDEHGGGETRAFDDPRAPGGDRGALRRFCVMALAGGLAVQRLTGRADDWAAQDIARVKRRIARLPADEQATFLAEAKAAAQRVVDRDWTLLADLARNLHRRGALDHVDVLNILNLAPSRRAAA